MPPRTSHRKPKSSRRRAVSSRGRAFPCAPVVVLGEDDPATQAILRALGEEAKVPARRRFQKLVEGGLITQEGVVVEHRNEKPTTLGELAKQARRLQSFDAETAGIRGRR